MFCRLLTTCVAHAKQTSLAELKTQPDFDKINPIILVDILSYKVERLEPSINAIKIITTHSKPNTSRWCTSTDSKDTHNRHDVGAKKGCLHCNNYNFEQVEKICSKLRV